MANKPVREPGIKTMFFKKKRRKRVSSGRLPSQSRPEKRKWPGAFMRGAARPRRAPRPVSSIQLPRIMPSTSSLPWNTETKARSSTSCVIMAVKPSASTGRMSVFSGVIVAGDRGAGAAPAVMAGAEVFARLFFFR